MIKRQPRDRDRNRERAEVEKVEARSRVWIKEVAKGRTML